MFGTKFHAMEHMMNGSSERRNGFVWVSSRMSPSSPSFCSPGHYIHVQYSPPFFCSPVHCTHVQYREIRAQTENSSVTIKPDLGQHDLAAAYLFSASTFAVSTVVTLLSALLTGPPLPLALMLLGLSHQLLPSFSPPPS